MDKIIGIYKITSPSGKIYIGQSIDVRRRIFNYKSLSCKKQTLIYHSIKKYGWDKHVFEIIHQCSKEELDVMEKHYVDLYKTFNTPHGLNLQDGGGIRAVQSIESNIKRRNTLLGRKRPKEVVEKMSISLKNTYKNGRISYWKGREKSLETINKTVATRKLRKYTAWNKGKPWGNESKYKMSVARKGVIPWNKGVKGAYKTSEETRIKMKESQKERWRLIKEGKK